MRLATPHARTQQPMRTPGSQGSSELAGQPLWTIIARGWRTGAVARARARINFCMVSLGSAAGRVGLSRRNHHRVAARRYLSLVCNQETVGALARLFLRLALARRCERRS